MQLLWCASTAMILICTGCATRRIPGTPFEPVFPVPAGKAVLYVYRLRDAHHEDFEIYINNHLLSRFPTDIVCRVIVDPGTYTLTISPERNWFLTRYRSTNLKVILGAGQEEFVSLRQFVDEIIVGRIDRETALVEMMVTDNPRQSWRTEFGTCEGTQERHGEG